MAYGAVASPPKSQGPLDTRLYRIAPRKSHAARDAAPSSTDAAAVVAVPFDTPAGDTLPPGLEKVLRDDFNIELSKGNTYPQREAMSTEEFRGYFLGADVIVGIVVNDKEAREWAARAGGANLDKLSTFGLSLGTSIDKSALLSGRDWSTCIGFSYYIKPNYPGRSSHLCNAGFVVPLNQRGRGLGSVAGQSFLHYGPRCGYRGSIFNLVYVNNVASVQIWERLGFERVGRIPGAGLLRVHGEDASKTDNANCEEYVDAWVIHGDFAKLSLRNQASEPAIA